MRFYLTDEECKSDACTRRTQSGHGFYLTDEECK